MIRKSIRKADNASSIPQCAHCRSDDGKSLAFFHFSGFRGAQCGMTLVELVISIVIIGIAAAALYSAMAVIVGRSADPVLHQQSLVIAEGYLEEILFQSYLDPTTLSSGSCAKTAGLLRERFDDVCDYADLDDQGVRDATGAVVTALSGYRVQVSVTQLDNWNGVPARRIDVEVTDPTGQRLVLSGFRTCYGEVDANGVDQCS